MRSFSSSAVHRDAPPDNTFIISVSFRDSIFSKASVFFKTFFQSKLHMSIINKCYLGLVGKISVSSFLTNKVWCLVMTGLTDVYRF